MEHYRYEETLSLFLLAIPLSMMGDIGLIILKLIPNEFLPPAILVFGISGILAAFILYLRSRMTLLLTHEALRIHYRGGMMGTDFPLATIATCEISDTTEYREGRRTVRYGGTSHSPVAIVTLTSGQKIYFVIKEPEYLCNAITIAKQ